VDGRKTKKLAEYLDSYPPAVREVARSVLNAELGQLHLQRAHNITAEIRQIVERQAALMERETAQAVTADEA
jgi:hypothetical protein